MLHQLHSIKKDAVANSLNHFHNDPTAVLFSEKFRNVEKLKNMSHDNFWELYKEVKNKLNKTYRTMADPDFLCSVSIIPHENGNIYGCIYDDSIHENRDLIMQFADEYHYQNQTDKPDDISDEDWEQRSEIWNEIFDEYISASDAGALYELVKTSDLHFGSIEICVKNFLDSIVHVFEIQTHKASENITEKDFDNIDLEAELSEFSDSIVIESLLWYHDAEMPYSISVLDKDTLDKILPILDTHKDLFTYEVNEKYGRKDSFKKLNNNE